MPVIRPDNAELVRQPTASRGRLTIYLGFLKRCALRGWGSEEETGIAQNFHNLALDSGLFSRVYAFDMPSNGHSMHIGDVSKQTNLSVDAIRFYERNALLPEPPRSAGHFRLYTDGDVTRLKFVRKMQSLGFSLREIRQILDLRENRLDACQEVSKLVKTKLEEVRVKIRDLKNLEQELARGLRKCNAELKHRNGTPRICPVLAVPDDKRSRKCE